MQRTIGTYDRLDTATVDAIIIHGQNLEHILRGYVPRSSRGRLTARLNSVKAEYTSRTGLAWA